MKILVFGINYYPEITGIGKYTTQLAEFLVSQNHNVKVITAPPYYPYWQVKSPYKAYRWKKEVINNVTILRSPLYVPKKISGLSRILHELSFMLGSIPYWLSNIYKKPDVIFCIYPPLPGTLIPLVFGKLFNIPVIYHVQDLQVDAARDLGIITNKRLLNLLENLEKFIFRKANKVTTISDGMSKRLSLKLQGKEIQIFPNGIDPKQVFPMEETKGLKSNWGYKEDDVVFLYSGNIGEKQGLEIIIKIAHAFVAKKNWQFLILGEGAYKEKLIHQSTSSKLTNVKFGSLVPTEQLNSLLNMADFHFILQKKRSSDLVMPSKLGPILSVGGIPIVGTDRGSFLHEQLDKYKFGLFFEAESVHALSHLLDNNLGNTELNRELSENGLRYAQKHLLNSSILPELEKEIQNLIKKQ